MGEPVSLPTTFGELRSALASSSSSTPSSRPSPSVTNLFDADAALLKENPRYYSTDVASLRRTIELQKLQGLQKVLHHAHAPTPATHATEASTGAAAAESAAALAAESCATNVLLSADLDGKVILGRSKPAYDNPYMTDPDPNDLMLAAAARDRRAELAELNRQREEEKQQEREQELDPFQLLNAEYMAFSTPKPASAARRRVVTVENVASVLPALESRIDPDQQQPSLSASAAASGAASAAASATASPVNASRRASAIRLCLTSPRHAIGGGDSEGQSPTLSHSPSQTPPSESGTSSSADFLTELLASHSSPYYNALKQHDAASRPHTADPALAGSVESGSNLPAALIAGTTPARPAQRHASNVARSGHTEEKESTSTLVDPIDPKIEEFFAAHSMTSPLAHASNASTRPASSSSAASSASKPLIPNLGPMPPCTPASMGQLWSSYQRALGDVHGLKVSCLALQDEVVWTRRVWEEAMVQHQPCEQKVAELEARVQSLESTGKASHENEERLRKEVEDLTRDRDAAAHTHAHEVAASSRDLADVRSKLADNLRKQLNWERESEQLHAQIRQVQQELSNKSTQVLELTNDVQSLNYFLDQSKSKAISELAIFTREKDDLTRTIDRLQSDKVALAAELEKERNVSDELRIRSARLDREATVARDDQTRKDQDRADKLVVEQRLRDEIASKDKTMQELKVQIYSHELAADKFRKQISTLTGDGASAATHIRALEAESQRVADAAQRERDGWAARQAEWAQAKSQLDTTVRDWSEKHASLTLHLSEAHQIHSLELELLKKDSLSTETALIDAKSQLELREKSLKDEQVQHEFRHRQAQHLQAELSAVNSNNVELRAELASHTNALKEVKTKYKQLKIQYLALSTAKQQSDKSEAALVIAERDLAQLKSELKQSIAGGETLKSELELARLEAKLHRDLSAEVAFLAARNKELKEKLIGEDERANKIQALQVEIANWRREHGPQCHEPNSTLQHQLDSATMRFDIVRLENSRLKEDLALARAKAATPSTPIAPPKSPTKRSHYSHSMDASTEQIRAFQASLSATGAPGSGTPTPPASGVDGALESVEVRSLRGELAAARSAHAEVSAALGRVNHEFHQYKMDRADQQRLEAESNSLEAKDRRASLRVSKAVADQVALEGQVHTLQNQVADLELEVSNHAISVDRSQARVERYQRADQILLDMIATAQRRLKAIHDKPGYLGLTFVESQSSVDGATTVVLDSISHDSPALLRDTKSDPNSARLNHGDTLHGINGVTVHTVSEVQAALAQVQAGATVVLLLSPPSTLAALEPQPFTVALTASTATAAYTKGQIELLHTLAGMALPKWHASMQRLPALPDSSLPPLPPPVLTGILSLQPIQSGDTDDVPVLYSPALGARRVRYQGEAAHARPNQPNTSATKKLARKAARSSIILAAPPSELHI